MVALKTNCAMKQMFAKAPDKKADSEKYEYDIFISYRRKPSMEAVKGTPDTFIHRHSTSLARSLASELKDYGYKVYFDCWYKKTNWKEALGRSKIFVVLLTGYSFDEEKDVSQECKGDEKGSAFRAEVEFILNGLENGKWEAERVHWINVDGGFDPDQKPTGKRILKTGITIRKLDTGRKNLLDSINDSDDPVFPPIPKEQGRTPQKKNAIWVSAAVVLLAMAVALCGKHYNDKLSQYKDSLSQYTARGILFSGGGTTKRYIANMGVDVNNYAPNSLYIHLPSSHADDILWDFINDSSLYYPVVLTAGEIDTLEVDSIERARFRENHVRILQYKLTSAPLLVQLRNWDTAYKTGDTISKGEFKKLLCNTKYKYATSPASGTRNAYMTIIQDGLGLKDGKYHKYTVFSPKKYEEYVDSPQIYLANEYYSIQKDRDKFVSLKIKKGSDIERLDLYLYTVGELDKNSNRYLPGQPVMELFDKLKLSIDTTKYSNPKALVIKLN